MNASRDVALDLASRIEGLGTIHVKRFFGGAALVAEGIQFGFVMHGRLYLRVDDLSRDRFTALGAAPFAYAGATKTVTVASYYAAPDEVLADDDSLRDWAADAYRAARLTPRKRSRRLSSSETIPPG